MFFRSTGIEDRYSDNSEQFNPKLCHINSIETSLEYIDKKIGKTNSNDFDTLQFIKETSKFTKERFFHGLARYKFSENWIAYVGSKFLWDHMSAMVDPNDILKNCGGLCSQQTIVFMELLKKRGIKVRTVGLGYKEGPGHFLCEVHYENAWHLHDVTLEPQWSKITTDHQSMEYYKTNKDSLYITYESRLSRGSFNKIMEKIEYGQVNEFPAKNMLLFHRATKTLTYGLPVIFGILSFASYRKRKLQAKEN
ncbi:MAG: hypothetical protein Q8M29_17775 [Bacteroidota bacterium]|nr:hypothetical protein [Bacteroidota bacterium]